MKLTLLSLFILFFVNVSNAQFTPTDYAFTWGEEQKQKGKATLEDILDSDENGFVVLKSTARRKLIATSVENIYNYSYTLEHYNPKLKRDKQIPLELDRFGKDTELLKLVKLRDKLYFFVSVLNKQNKDNELWVGSADYNTLKIDKTKTKLITLNYNDYSKKNSGKFRIHTSRDDSRLIVYFRNPAKKNENAAIGFQVYNNQMELQYQHSQKLNFKEDLLDFEKMYVDEEGNAYSLFKIYKNKRDDEKKGEANYYYLISSYLEEGKQINDYKISLPGLFIADMSFTVDDMDQIICSGFYSNEGVLNYQGTYYQRINRLTGEVVKSSKKAFDPGFIMENLSGKEARKNSRKARRGDEMGLSDFVLGDLILRDDGGCVLVAEQYEEKWITSTVNNQYSSYKLYYFNDIIVVNIDANGEIGWSKKFPKRQVANDQIISFASYSIAVVNDKIALMYNDHKDNLKIGANEKPTRINGLNKMITILALISVDGEESKHSLFSIKDADKIVTRPARSEQIDEHTLIIYCERGKKERFAKLKL